MSASVAAPTPASSAPVASADTEVAKKQRRVVSSESVAATFDELQKLVEQQIEALRQAANSATGAKTGSTGIKFLRTVNSRVKQLKKDAVKVMDASKKRPRRQTTNEGGFLKPQHVTAEMASFAGWAPTDMKSRVDVTNAICRYVKEKNLQDPTCKKHILPDSTLKALIQYDPLEAGNAPLTYFYLQKLLGRLLVKPAPAAAAPSAGVAK